MNEGRLVAEMTKKLNMEDVGPLLTDPTSIRTWFDAAVAWDKQTGEMPCPAVLAEVMGMLLRQLGA